MSEERRLTEIAERYRRMLSRSDNYVSWANAGGPNECKHGYAAGVPCFDCDDAMSANDIPWLLAEVERLRGMEAHNDRMYAALVRNRRGYQNLLEFRKLDSEKWGQRDGYGGRYGALTRDEIDAVISEIDTALLDGPKPVTELAALTAEVETLRADLELKDNAIALAYEKGVEVMRVVLNTASTARKS